MAVIVFVKFVAVLLATNSTAQPGRNQKISPLSPMRRGRTQAHENTVPVAREWWCNGVTNCPQSVFSRQRRRELAGGRSWERTLPASSVLRVSNARQQDACAPRRTRKNPFQVAKNFAFGICTTNTNVKILRALARIFRQMINDK